MNIFNTNVDLLHKEVLVSTDINTQLWNICVWDYTSGSHLLSFNNCSVQTHGLSFINNDYMLCAASNKPFIYYWNLKSRNPQQLKISLSGPVSALEVSKCGNYIVVGIEDKTYILHTYSGSIINCLGRHYQKITDIRFTYDDKYLITASHDSIILVWNFKEVCNNKDELLEPLYSLDSHTLSINDLYTSQTMNKLVSVSSDQTCKLWNLNTGQLNCSLSFSSNPTRVILDSLEANIYIGFSTGSILTIPIKAILHESNKIVSDQDYGQYIGHKQQITCLSISLDNSKLASGSDDTTIRLWDTLTRQCLKVLNHNGKITNLQFKSGSLFFSDDYSANVPLFSRYNPIDLNDSSEIMISKILKKSNIDDNDDIKDVKYFINLAEINEQSDEYFELKNKFENIKKANENIYDFAINQLLK